MNFEIVETEEKTVCGLPVKLTNSQTKNYEIISNHWKLFNRELRNKTRNTGGNWEKYGLTCKQGEDYFYMPSIPYSGETGFEKYTILKGRYVCFQHKGDMRNLKITIYDIYKKFLPDSGFKINAERIILHYERYNYRFKWNSVDSIIEIYLPIENND